MSTVYEDAFAHAADLLRADYQAQGQEEQFALWFNMRYVGDDGDVITVETPSAFMWRMMTDKGFVSAVTKSLAAITGKDIQLSPTFTGQQVSPISSSSSSSSLTEEKQQPSVITLSGSSSAPAASAVAGVYRDDPLATVKTLPPHPTLLPRFTFDQFVTGENSEYAYNVCQAAAREPGTKFNPILLYGGVGLGKTHLMQAIGNYIWRESGGHTKIVCAAAETFCSDYTSALKQSKLMDKFKAKYRQCDVLLLDDIHFFQGKFGMQEELFNTYNVLRDKNRQLVFTCDRPIAQLQKMVDRLSSRLSNGQCVDLRAPGYEVRRAILRKKAAENHARWLMSGSLSSEAYRNVAASCEATSDKIVSKPPTIVPPEVIDYIAQFIETNVRDLESALNKVTGYAEMTGKVCDVDMARHLLVDMKAPQSTAVTIEAIQKAVAAEYSVTVAELKGKKRDKRLAYPRQVACYLCRELTESAFSDIGRQFGGRDHATIMHACDVIGTEMKLNADTDDRITKLISIIKGV